MLKTGRCAREERSKFFGIDRAVLAIVKIAGSALLVVGNVISVLRRKRVVFAAALLLASLSALILLPTNNQVVQAATSNQLNFQGRLLTDTGGLVPDGTYNVEFKLYYVPTVGTAQWTETRTAGNAMTVRNGYFSVYLGDVTAFPGTIDWSQDLYLGMNVAGDGEMSPRFKMTSVPYAFRAANVASSDTNAASTDSDEVSITTGDALGVASNSGDITVDTGTATGTAGSISVGTANSSSLTLGRSGVSTLLQGNVRITSLTTNGFVKTNSGNGTLSVSTTVNLASEVSGTLPVASGGTGANSYSATNGVIYYNGTSLVSTAAGTTSQCLIGNTGSAPSWGGCPGDGVGLASLNGQTGSTQTFANDTNVTISSASNVHTLGWTGTLAVSRGGTGASTSQGAINNISQLTTNGDLLYFNGSNSTRLPRGTSNQCLISSGTTIQWGSCYAGGSGFTSISLAGTSGTPQTISESDTITIAAGTNITTTAGATDTVTIATVGNPSFSGVVTSANAFSVTNPNNVSANVSLNWLSDVARIRIGGTGTGASNGLDIQGTGDTSLLRIPQSGDVVVANGLTVTAGGVNAALASGTGSAICIDGSNNFVTCTGASVGVTSLNSLTGALSVVGTANQITVTPSGSNITLSLPQNIATTSSPQFSNLTLTGDLAVNGGDITSSASTLNINAGGTVNIQDNLIVSGELTTTKSRTYSATYAGGEANEWKRIGYVGSNNGTMRFIGNIAGHDLNTAGQGQVWFDIGFSYRNGFKILGDASGRIPSDSGSRANVIAVTDGATLEIWVEKAAYTQYGLRGESSGSAVLVDETWTSTDPRGRVGWTTEWELSDSLTAGTYNSVTWNGSATPVAIINNSNFGVGTSGTPASLLSVGGTTGNLQVNSSGAITVATGITSSGTITFSGLNSVGVVQTNGSGVLSTGNLNLGTGPVTGTLGVSNGGTGASTLTGLLIGNGAGAFTATTTSTGISGQISDETGSGALVFGTTPTFATSVLTNTANFSVFNTNATTVNAFGAATTINMGASGGTATFGNGGAFTLRGSNNQNLTVSTQGTGSLTLSSASGNTFFSGESLRNVTRTMPTVVDDTVDIGSFTFTSGAGNLRITITVPSTSFSVSKTYELPILYNQTSNNWVIAQPISDTGAYGSNNYALDVRVNNSTTSLRIRRTSGSTAGTAYVTIQQTGNASDTFTASTATASVTAPTSFLSSAITSQTGGVFSAQGNITSTGTITGSSTSNSVFGNGTTGGIQIGDGTITKTSGSGFTTSSYLNPAQGYYVNGTSVISASRVIQNATGITSSGTVTFTGLGSGTGSAVCLNGSNQLVTCTAGSGAITGSGSANEVPYFTSSSVLSSNSNLTYNGSLFSIGTSVLTVNASTGDSSFDSDSLFVDASTNRIGLGTSSPGTTLDVRGSLRTYDGTSRGVLITSNGEIEQVSASDWLHLQRYQSGQVVVGNNSGASLYVASGNLGIGNTSTAIKLQVGSVAPGVTSEGQVASFYTGNDTSVSIISSTNNNGQGPRLRLFENNPNRYGTELFYDSGANSFAITNYSNNSVTGSITLLSNGNVGIADTSPTNKLDINGSIGISDTTVITAGRVVQNATGISSSGTITFTGLSSAGIVTNTSGGVLGTTTSIGDSYLSSNVALLNNTQTFTGAKTFSATLTASAAGTGLSVTNNATIGGVLTVSGRTIQLSNLYPEYNWYWGGGTDLNWKKIADVTIGGGAYAAASFQVEVIDANCNYGCSADLRPMKFYVSAVRSAGVVDSPDNGNVSGPVNEFVRLVKTATGTYELQVRQATNYRHMNVKARLISQLSATVSYVDSPTDGSTVGSIYTVTTNGYTERFPNVSAAGNLTSAGTITFSGLSTAGIVTNTSGGVLGTTTSIGDSYLSSNVALLNATQTFTGVNTFSNTLNTAAVNASGTITSTAGTSLRMENQAIFQAKNSGGTYETFLWPRWSDNILYMNYGSGGYRLRNNSSTTILSIDNAGAASFSGTLGVTGNTTLTANLTVNGNTTLGNATSDTVTFTGRVNSDILPSVDDTYDLGSNTLRWQDLYLGPNSLHVGTNGNEGILSYNTTGSNFNLDKQTTIQGNLTLDCGTGCGGLYRGSNTGVELANRRTSYITGNWNAQIYQSGTSAGSYPFNVFGHTIFSAGNNRDIVFTTNNTTPTPVLIVHDTSVGVGPNTPNYPLDVTGDVNSTTGYRVNGTAGVSATCGAGEYLQSQVVSGGITTGGTCTTVAGGVGGSGATNRVAYWSGTSTLTSSANFQFNGSDLGIGGAATETFEVHSSTANDARISVNETGDSLSTQYSGLEFNDSGTFRGGLFKTGDTNDLQIWLSTGAALTVQQSTGNVGIGNNDPGQRLVVQSSGTIANVNVDSAFLRVTDGTNSLNFDPNEIVATNDLNINATAGPINFKNGSTQKAVLNSTGQFRLENAGTDTRLTLAPYSSGTANLWNFDNSGGTLRVYRENWAASGSGAGGSVKLQITDAGDTTLSGNLTVSGTGVYNLAGYISQNVTGSNYDLWIMGGSSTAGGDARNLAILGDSANDVLYLNYGAEYDGGTVLGSNVSIGSTNTLSFGSAVSAKIYLYDTTYGFGISGSTLQVWSGRYVNFNEDAYGGNTAASLDTQEGNFWVGDDSINHYIELGADDNYANIATTNGPTIRIMHQSGGIFDCYTDITNTGGAGSNGGNTHIDTGGGYCATGADTGAVYINWYAGEGLYVGNGTTAGNYGPVAASAFNINSSRDVKNTIQTSPYGLQDILKLNPVTYYYNDGTPGLQLGLIAEDVYQVIPEIVQKDTNGKIFGLDYGKFTPALISAVKELNVKVDSNASRISKLEASNTSLTKYNITVTNQLTANKLVVTGTTQLASLKVTGNTELAKLTVNGKIVSKGNVPTTEVLGTSINLAEAEVTGTDVAGSITMTTDVLAPVDGKLRLVFNTAYDVPPIVNITAVGRDGAQLGAYVESTTENEVIINFINDPAAEKEYQFNYQIIQAVQNN